MSHSLRRVSVGLVVLCTAALAARSASAGFRAVARWDVVPDQLLTTPFKVGVIAFHLSGVKVEFRVKGTLVSTALNPTYNDQSNVWEFWFTLKPSLYPDGPLTIDARIIPLEAKAVTYDLPSLNFYANSHGTLGSTAVKWVDAVNGSDANAGTQNSPYKTILKAVQSTPAGGTINLQAGNYTANSPGGSHINLYWTTIQAAPGVARDDVQIAPGSPRTQRLKWTNVSFYTDSNVSTGYATCLADNTGAVTWTDNCKFYNKQGRWVGGQTQPFGGGFAAVYVTGGLTTQMCKGPGVQTLVRGHQVRTIAAHAFWAHDGLVVNCSVNDIDPGPTGAHPDYCPAANPVKPPNWNHDVILYNCSGYDIKAQGLSTGEEINSAYVNVLIQQPLTADGKRGGGLSQFGSYLSNILFLHVTEVTQTWYWRTRITGGPVAAENCLFDSMTSGYSLSSLPPNCLTIDHNHVVDESVYGSVIPAGANSTTGNARYANAPAYDFHILPSSPAYGTGTPMQCVPADISGVPYGLRPNRGALSNTLPFYSLRAAAQPSGAGTVTSGPYAGGYNAGDVLQIQATSATGYAFGGWTVSGGSVTNVSSASTSLTITGNCALTANFTATAGAGAGP
ncbi:MAG: DUF1565 domain-containing protein [Thermoguttaceae bacterium]|jgi:hypothetical protein